MFFLIIRMKLIPQRERVSNKKYGAKHAEQFVGSMEIWQF